ncbi:unnamed protein product [Wuchereria bancrofti]|uniref:Uncharacterized protein n=1 Tax=Wuchereria bancrofti TaxID=6293 RepID=A0A3P7E9T3_WUCBA|nr:unnamed protein product [Wuchereria bancrofti]
MTYICCEYCWLQLSSVEVSLKVPLLSLSLSFRCRYSRHHRCRWNGHSFNATQLDATLMVISCEGKARQDKAKQSSPSSSPHLQAE